MANNIIKRIWNQNKMVNIEALQGMAFQAEDGGHTFEISGVDNRGNPVALSGTVAGVFVRPDNADIALSGTASDGKVYVTLSDACYAVPGKFFLTIFVTADSKKTAVYAAIGTVSRTSSGVVAGDTPQDVVDLINAINAAVETIPADYTDLMAAVAHLTNYKSIPLELKQWRVLSGKIAANNSHRAVVFPVTDGHTYTVHVSGKVNRNLVYGISADTVDVDTAATAITYNPGITSSTTDPEDTVITPSGYNFIMIVFAYSTASPFPFDFTATVTKDKANTFKVDGVKVPTVEAVFSEEYVDKKTTLQKVHGVQRFPGNLIDPSACIDGQVVAYNTGSISVNASYFRTGFIPVTAGNSYKSNVGRNHSWYKSDYSYLSGASGTGIQEGVEAPENAAYLLFNINKESDGIDNPLDLYLAETDDFIDGTFINGLNTTPFYYGKTINWIGDSIVAGPDFDEMVCKKLGMLENDYGISSCTIALNGNGSDGRNALCARYSSMTDDADIVAVSCGTNDFEYAWCPIGTIDSTENNTFYGALKTLCAGLIDKYPDKLIFFTTPIKRAQPFENGAGGTYTEDGVMLTPFSKNKYGLTLGDYADIIKEVCGYYSIPVLDMYRESLLNPHIAAQQDLFDNLLTHPNDAGRQIMARRVSGWLAQLAL